jgi:hypothetical protein
MAADPQSLRHLEVCSRAAAGSLTAVLPLRLGPDTRPLVGAPELAEIAGAWGDPASPEALPGHVTRHQHSIIRILQVPASSISDDLLLNPAKLAIQWAN